MLERLLAFDHSLSARLAIRRAGLLRITLQAIAHTGDGVVWMAIGVGLFLIRQTTLALRVEVAVFALIAIVTTLKFAFRRRRPTGQRGKLYLEVDAHSFPSGHAARMASMAVIVGGLNPTAAVGMGVWAALVSLARVMLGIHFLSDVAVGAALGIVMGAVVTALV